MPVPDISHQLLTRIGRDGSMTTFNPEKVTDATIREWSFQDFAITSDSVWLLAAISSKSHSPLNYVLKFNTKGDYKGALQLEGDLYMEQLAVFDSGEFLVSGTERIGRGQDQRFQAVTAMLDKQGRFVKRVEPEEENKQTDQQKAANRPATEVSADITLGTAEPYGREIYVLRASATPEIWAISVDGNVARRFVLEPPSPEAGLGQMRVVQGQIAVEFTKPKPGSKPGKPGEPVFYDDALSEYVVYDAFTGDRIGGYTRAPSLSGSFVCFDGRGGFDFLDTTESGPRKIVRAGAR